MKMNKTDGNKNGSNSVSSSYLVLMERIHPDSWGNGYGCLSWYTRPAEEESGGSEFALNCTIQRLVAYNRDKQLFGRVILVYRAPKRGGDKPIACYNVAGVRIW
jgi:hypothetical protein